MDHHDRKDLERMPGSPLNSSNRLEDYLVVLNEERNHEEAYTGRAGLYEAGVSRNSAFQKQLRSYLKKQGVSDRDVQFGDPTVFPLVILRCSPEVAAVIGRHPDVVDVVKNFGTMEMLGGGVAGAI